MAVIRIHEALLKLGIDSSILVLTKITNTPGVVSYLPKSSNKYIQAFFNRIDNVRHRFWTLLNPIVRDNNKKHIRNDCFYTLPLSPYRVERHPLVKNADVIHLHWVENFINYPSFFKSINKPIVWTHHDVNSIYGGFHHLKDKLDFYEKYKEIEDYLLGIKKSSLVSCRNIHIVCLSNYIKSQLASCSIYQNRQLTTIHNLVDFNLFSVHEKIIARRQNGLPADKKIILFVADEISDANKGLYTLVNALKIINEKSLFLCIVGNNRKGIVVEHPHSMLGHIGDQEQLSTIYSSADLFVLASRQESFGQTMLESISSGTPVVSFPCGISEELINDSNGIRCKDFSVEELVRCIKVALDKTYDSQVMRQDIIESFSPEHIAQQYIELYRQMMVQ